MCHSRHGSPAIEFLHAKKALASLDLASLTVEKVLVFAGAGIVRGSTAASEWEEVHVKMKNFVSLFPCAKSCAPLSAFSSSPNLNALWSSVLVEELLRSGLAHVVLSPGSRCAPLTVAVAQSGCAHTLANDERGAAFIALGLARATGRCAAVVVSSGTAVANLLPAVIEAHQARHPLNSSGKGFLRGSRCCFVHSSQDRVPLLLITADRPAELRDTGANQTIDQVGLLGRHLNWFKDMPCPDARISLESLLSDASYALAKATSVPCGPVHLNVMLREPLSPSVEPWPPSLLQTPRVEAWTRSRQPFASYLSSHRQLHLDAPLISVIAHIRGARRGILVAGAMHTSEQRLATAALAARIGWPLLPDVCSGLRKPVASLQGTPLVPLYDLLLCGGKETASTLKPDVIIQVRKLLVRDRQEHRTVPKSCLLLTTTGSRERDDAFACGSHG